MNARHRMASTLAIVAVLLASPVGATCPPRHGAGATVLFPYLEVDLDRPTGINTLISLDNLDDSPVLVNVVLWTDWGLPALDFNLYLPPHRVQNLDLRRLLVDGVLPTTGPGTGAIPDAPSCRDPLVMPTLDDEARARLRRLLTGIPDPDDGLCSSSGARGPGVATGYLTVDTIHDCTSTIRLPEDEGYFVFGGMGVASNRNVLAGTFFLITGNENAAQGMRAVALPADDTIVANVPTFYRGLTSSRGADQRLPLGDRARMRYLTGGTFDGGTDLLLWTAGVGTYARPTTCGSSPGYGELRTVLRTDFRDQAGNEDTSSVEGSYARALRIERGDPLFSPERPFGSVDVAAYEECIIVCGAFPEGPVQTWGATVVRAGGRFSVGVPGLCRP